METTSHPPIDLIVDSRLLSHEFHLAETIECACGYRRPEDYRPEWRGIQS
jgi:hypothetical protein